MATVTASATTASTRAKPRLFLTSGWYALGLFGLAIVAFWKLYVVKLPFEAEFFVNLHAVGVVAWMLMLTTQPLLIRAGKRSLHRRIGKISYGLVPFVVLGSLLLAHHRLAALSIPDFQTFGKDLYLPVVADALFVTCYSLAILNRRNAFVHPRYMIATALPLIDPVTYRLLLFYSPLKESDLLFPAVGYAITDAILLLLIWLDRNEPRGRNAFLRLLPIFIVGHIGWFTLGQTQAWFQFAASFRDLPLP
jgi:hypothetical protein